MNEITIDFAKDLKIDEVREEVNLMMFNSPLFSIEQMKLSNEIFKRLKNVKLQISSN